MPSRITQRASRALYDALLRAEQLKEEKAGKGKAQRRARITGYCRGPAFEQTVYDFVAGLVPARLQDAADSLAGCLDKAGAATR